MGKSEQRKSYEKLQQSAFYSSRHICTLRATGMHWQRKRLYNPCANNIAKMKKIKREKVNCKCAFICIKTRVQQFNGFNFWPAAKGTIGLLFFFLSMYHSFGQHAKDCNKCKNSINATRLEISGKKWLRFSLCVHCASASTTGCASMWMAFRQTFTLCVVFFPSSSSFVSLFLITHHHPSYARFYFSWYRACSIPYVRSTKSTTGTLKPHTTR